MNRELFRRIHELLNQNQKMVVARIIRRYGSAPRDVGSVCVVTDDGRLFGTIGGGLLEHRAMQEAKDVLLEGKSRCFKMFLTGKDAAASGMICGGDVEVYLEPLFPDNRDLAVLYSGIDTLIELDQEGVLLTKVADNISALETRAHLLSGKTGAIGGAIEGLQGKTFSLPTVSMPEMVTFPDLGIEVLLEPIKHLPTVYLFGAGHVAACVSPLANMVGFRVVVIDDRPEFANQDRFPHADEIRVQEFPKVFDEIAINDSSYIVIVTRGHLHDRIVLECAMGTEPAYIGMIGSRRKNAAIMEALRAKGIPDHRLTQVHAPIGIKIDAETPEEIAISIVAELIQVRAERTSQKKLL
jgi:xanthine dehydrogenase accessory factor